MPIKFSYIRPLLAVAAAAAIATSPTEAAHAASTQPTAIATALAAAHPTPSICNSLGGSATQCQMPGNVQINDAPLQCANASLERFGYEKALGVPLFRSVS